MNGINFFQKNFLYFSWQKLCAKLESNLWTVLMPPNCMFWWTDYALKIFCPAPNSEISPNSVQICQWSISSKVNCWEIALGIDRNRHWSCQTTDHQACGLNYYGVTKPTVLWINTSFERWDACFNQLHLWAEYSTKVFLPPSSGGTGPSQWQQTGLDGALLWSSLIIPVFFCKY